jgi:GxxExxY protein
MDNKGRNDEKVIYKELSYKLIGIMFDVYNELGHGYKEITYEKAIEQYLKFYKISYNRQVSYLIAIKGEIVSRRRIDFIISNKIVLEVKKEIIFQE